MLAILLATCERALEAFQEPDTVNRELVADLERIIERTRRELEDRTEQVAPSG